MTITSIGRSECPVEAKPSEAEADWLAQLGSHGSQLRTEPSKPLAPLVPIWTSWCLHFNISLVARRGKLISTTFPRRTLINMLFIIP
jgi:hypothetical protein